MHVRRSSVAAHCNEVRCPAASPRGATCSSASGVRAAAARAGAPAWLDEHRIALGMHAEATHAPPLSSARALRRPDESRPVRLDDRVVARLSRAVDCVRCAVVRACVVVVVARADARPTRASARHRVRMRPFAPYALPAHGAPMHAFGARRSQTPCICSAGADEAAARKRARPESHARAFASIRFITPANPWTIPFFHVLPTPPPAHRRPSRSFACIGRRALAAFVDCFVGCFADNSWLRSTAAHEAWRACVAPARGAVACRPDCTSSCSRTAPPFWLTSEYWRPLYCSRSLECRSHRTYF